MFRADAQTRYDACPVQRVGWFARRPEWAGGGRTIFPETIIDDREFRVWLIQQIVYAYHGYVLRPISIGTIQGRRTDDFLADMRRFFTRLWYSDFPGSSNNNTLEDRFSLQGMHGRAELRPWMDRRNARTIRTEGVPQSDYSSHPRQRLLG